MNRDYKTPDGAAPPDWRGLCEELAEDVRYLSECLRDPDHGVDPVCLSEAEDDYHRARAALAQPEPEGRPAPAPAGEVAELVAWLRDHAHVLNPSARSKAHHIADLLERQAAPVPVGMIPVEYCDLDSGARIVSEPSEEGPGGCWVVLNSRVVNPLTEFPTAEAAWNALQAAHSLPLPSGKVEHG